MEPVDYLLIGHLTRDLTPGGPRLGGTVTYAALTVRALGMRAGIVTSVPEDFDLLAPLADVQMVRRAADQATTFQNIYDPQGRRAQTLLGRASPLTSDEIPERWRRAPVVHLAPVIDEVPPTFARYFSNALVGVTPQGWLRRWDEKGRVRASRWSNPGDVLDGVTAVVFSIEDVGFDAGQIDEYARQAHVLVVTRGEEGCSVHWNDGWRDFPAPSVPLVNPTGAGDIFAAAFFYRLHLTRDPHEAARFAVQIASASVTRAGLDSIPTPEDIRRASRRAP